MYMCMCVFMHVCMYVCMRVHVCIYICMCVHACVCVRVCARVYMQVVCLCVCLKYNCYFFKAWSTIVHLLIPNINQLETSLNSFATILDADEVLLFEKATFLVSNNSNYSVIMNPSLDIWKSYWLIL